MAEQYFFEVKLEEGTLQGKFLKEDRKDFKKHQDFLKGLFKQIKGLVSAEQVFPFMVDEASRHLVYLNVKSKSDPWSIAEEIEALHFVEYCIPDLATNTYINPDSLGAENNAVRDLEFLNRWSNSLWVEEAVRRNSSISNAHRWWNWTAVNFPMSDIERTRIFGWDGIVENLKKLSMVQLDTGYTDHSKVKDSFDYDRDEDFVDEDHDAKDEMKGYVHPLQFPRHGTRTASLVTGTSIKPAYDKDGNAGLLTLNNKSLIKLIPYRISRSPVLIGRGKDTAAAAYVAIERNADVVFMCMGSYPRPMLSKVARHAYERGVIWVCAAGNEVRLVVAPALYPGTVAVAAINPDNKPWRGSSRGLSVDISAPGEDVYVPRVDGKEETMSYGNGTSYATPHVASAAMLWKAKHYNELSQKYTQPWQIVEAFRYCLKQSANREHWENSAKFGAGLLDVTKLLETPLPEAYLLEHAYNNSDSAPETRWNLRTIEEVHNAWQQGGSTSQKIRSDEASDEELLLKEYFESYESAAKVQIFEE